MNEFDVALVRGDLLLATGDRIVAEESYRRALAIATEQGAKTLSSAARQSSLAYGATRAKE